MKTPTLPAGPNNTHAFTLLELLVVIAIVGIMGSLAYPLVRPDKNDSRIAMNRLLYQLEELRNTAATRGQAYIVKQEPREDTWQVWPLPLTVNAEADAGLAITPPKHLRVTELITPIGRQDNVAFSVYPDLTTDPYVFVMESTDDNTQWRMTFNGTVLTGRIGKDDDK